MSAGACTLGRHVHNSAAADAKMIEFDQGRISPGAYVVGVFYVLRGERMLTEQLHLNLLFSWFVGLANYVGGDP